jgi:tetratricopeptide (TPR) repeat protein
MKNPSKHEKQSKHPGSEENTSMEAEGRKASPMFPQTKGSSRLLRESKTTTAALSLLEKAIKLIYDREFKKARVELKTILDTCPGETEILARVRTYIRICEREEAAHKRPAVTNDQLYTLGVMAHNRGDYDAAASYFKQAFEKHKNADYVYYSLAASMAMKGEFAEATTNLRKAIELNEENRVYAKNDADFSSLHADKDFADLVGISLAPPDEQ